MIAYWCGFNGFNQISYENSSIAFSQFCLVPLDNIKDIDFSWSCAIIVSDGDACISGFNGIPSCFIKRLTKPEPKLQVACNETYALLISEDGECWQYFYNAEKWKKLLKFTSVEETTDVAGSEHLELLHNNLKSSEECSSTTFKRNVIKICCGETVNIALDDLGQAYSIPSPIPMPGIKIMEVACGFEHCLLLDDFGRVYSSGSGMRGQLGSGTLETVDSPQEIEALGGLRVTHIAAGGWHSAAVTDSGVLYTWGWNNSGQLGFPTVESSDTLPSSERDVEQQNVQNETSLCYSNTQGDLLSKDKENVENCGTKEHTKCALEGCENNDSDGHKNKKIKPTALEELREPSKIPLCSENETEEKKFSEMCKGKDGSGTDSSVEQEYVTVLADPKPVDFPMQKDVDIVDVSCGNRHTVALAGDGSMWGCGWNAYGQLGKSLDTFVSVDRMIRLDIVVNKKICRVHCGGWNTVVFCEK